MTVESFHCRIDDDRLVVTYQTKERYSVLTHLEYWNVVEVPIDVKAYIDQIERQTRKERHD